MSYEPFSEGFCWECNIRLVAKDKWAICPQCNRWFRAEGSVIVERIPLPLDVIGKKGCCASPDQLVVMADGSTRAIIGDESNMWVPPVGATHIEVRTVVDQAGRA